MKPIAELIKEQTFFVGLSPEDIAYVAECGKPVSFKKGEVISRRGDPMTVFYLIVSGSVSLAIDVPPKQPFVFQTLEKNDILGLSWLIPPYKWTLSAKASEETQAIAFHAACLRGKCEQDPRLGYKIMQQLVQVILMRAEALRLRVLDVYG